MNVAEDIAQQYMGRWICLNVNNRQSMQIIGYENHPSLSNNPSLKVRVFATKDGHYLRDFAIEFKELAFYSFILDSELPEVLRAKSLQLEQLAQTSPKSTIRVPLASLKGLDSGRGSYLLACNPE